MPLPTNYKFSQWVIQSNLDKEKKRKKYEHELNMRWDANEHLKVARKQGADSAIIYTTENAIGTYVTGVKDKRKQFNYSRQDKLKVFSSIILDLHDESNTLEKLDKMYDIRDGFQI